jgi:hypothetical protein
MHGPLLRIAASRLRSGMSITMRFNGRAWQDV